MSMRPYKAFVTNEVIFSKTCVRKGRVVCFADDIRAYFRCKAKNDQVCEVQLTSTKRFLMYAFESE